MPVEFRDATGSVLCERFPSAEDFDEIVQRTLSTPGFSVKGYSGAFIDVYQALRRLTGPINRDWHIKLILTDESEFICTMDTERVEITAA
jgi:hypothetical protein